MPNPSNQIDNSLNPHWCSQQLSWRYTTDVIFRRRQHEMSGADSTVPVSAKAARLSGS